MEGRLLRRDERDCASLSSVVSGDPVKAYSTGKATVSVSH